MPKISKGCRMAATVSLCGLNPSRTRLIAAALAMASGFLSAQAHALTFNVTYDSSVSSAPLGFQSAFQDAINFYQTSFSNPITINLNVGWGEVNGSTIGSGALGESSSNGIGATYIQVRNALSSVGAPGYLPASDPTGGRTIYVSTANAKAIGLGHLPPSTDGYVGFNNSVNWTFDPAQRAQSGAYDFIGIAHHEISEVMGRFSTLGWNNYESVQDLFRYTATGALDLSGRSAYFSMDGGYTKINTFNGSSSTGDLGDWAGQTVDAYNAFASSGQELPVSAGDLKMMASLGYTAIAPVPEPSEAAFMLAGLGLLGWRYRRKAA